MLYDCQKSISHSPPLFITESHNQDMKMDIKERERIFIYGYSLVP